MTQFVARKKYIGKIIKLDREKGYGFISTKEIPFTRIFFHWTGLANETSHFTELEVGWEAEFEVIESQYGEGNKGLRAIHIWILEDDGEHKTKRDELDNAK